MCDEFECDGSVTTGGRHADLANLILLNNAIFKKQHKDALKYTQMAQKSFQENGLTNANALVNLKYVEVAMFVAISRSFKTEDVQPVLQGIYDLLGPTPKKGYDINHLKLSAWLSAVNNVIVSRGRKKEEAIELKYPEPEEPRVNICPEFVWDSRDPPQYPSGLLERGYVGSAIIFYLLDKDGKTHDIEVAVEVPSQMFGRYAVRAAKNWKGHFTSEPSKACLSQQLNTSINFRFGDSTSSLTRSRK